MQMTNNCFLQKVLTAIILIIRKGLKILGAGGHCPLKDVPCLQKMHTATKKSIMTRFSTSLRDGLPKGCILKRHQQQRRIAKWL